MKDVGPLINKEIANNSDFILTWEKMVEVPVFEKVMHFYLEVFSQAQNISTAVAHETERRRESERSRTTN